MIELDTAKNRSKLLRGLPIKSRQSGKYATIRKAISTSNARVMPNSIAWRRSIVAGKDSEVLQP